MEQIYAAQAGGPEVLKVKKVKRPTPEDDELLIKVAATAVNRLLQCKSGKNVFGFECSGEIFEMDKMVTGWKLNDKIHIMAARWLLQQV
ncbi:hypothetical protein ACH5RR_035322 [Cinchona calisaya]|uniref:Uncharacterized protein n=1 Tax=Cinchona calisaya TaxID=153742 RepID=A0ABD2YFJ5_9GENT